MSRLRSVGSDGRWVELEWFQVVDGSNPGWRAGTGHMISVYIKFYPRNLPKLNFPALQTNPEKGSNPCPCYNLSSAELNDCDSRRPGENPTNDHTWCMESAHRCNLQPNISGKNIPNKVPPEHLRTRFK